MLAATVGLRPESVGRVRMRLSEGLAGLVGEQLRRWSSKTRRAHPRFKYFREAGEDPYHSFLGVPLIDRGLLQGVLVVQTLEPRAFSADVVRMLTMAGAQLAPIVEPGAHARQFVAPAHQRLSRSRAISGGAGITTPRACSATLDPVLWRELDHNPIALLQQIPVARLEERASELVLHSRINYAYRRMQEYLTSTHTWGARHAGVLWARPVAYFSAEFGLHESVPIYSGGLGILAGDHIKAASDLGIPLVGIGLYYDQGYFRSASISTAASRRTTATSTARCCRSSRRRDADGKPVTVAIETRTGTIVARVWKLAVGRNTLLLLDSDVDGNQPEDRELTSRLYGGDERVRIRQELLLGVGGVRR